jgi:hypothetical protein
MAIDWDYERSRCWFPTHKTEEVIRPMTWQPIDTAPNDGSYLLLLSPAHGRVIGAHVTGDVWHLVGVGTVTSESERPTNWMALPDPPKADDAAEPPDPLANLRAAKYLNPACAEQGCQWLTAKAPSRAR